MRRKSFSCAFVALVLLLSLFPASLLEGLNGRVLADGDDELPEIQNVVLSSDRILTWDPVEGAGEYSVGIELDGKRVIGRWTTSATANVGEFCDQAGIAEGKLKIKLTAYKSALTAISKPYVIEFDYVSPNPKLDIPSNLRWNGTVLSWDPMGSAVDYYVRFTFSEDGGETWNLESIQNASKDAFIDLGPYLARGTNLYRVTVQAGRTGYPYSDKAEIRKEFTFDKEVKVSMDEFTNITVNYNDHVCYKCTASHDGQQLFDLVYGSISGNFYLYDILKSRKVPYGTIDFEMTVMRNIGGQLYPLSEKFAVSYDFAEWDLLIAESMTDMRTLSLMFDNKVCYEPAEKRLTFNDLDMDEFDGWLFDPEVEDFSLFASKNDMTIKGKVKANIPYTFVNCEKTLRIDKDSDLSVSCSKGAAIAAESLIVEGGTLNIKSAEKNGLLAKTSISIAASVKSVTSEGASGYGAIFCTDGKIALDDKIIILEPEEGNLGSDAHAIYNADKKTVATKAKLVPVTPTPTEVPATPTPTKKAVSPTPTKKVVSPTPTPKAVSPTPTLTKAPTKTPTKVPTLIPTPTMAVVKMPDVVGMQYEEAQDFITKVFEDGGIPVITIRICWVQNNDPEKTCQVVQQNPEAGEYVYGSGIIEIVLYVAEQGATPTPVTPAPVTPTPGEPTPVEPTPGEPTPDPEKEPSIADFVERLYTIALARESEPEGKAFWVNEIESGNRTGGDCAHFFLIEAPEFLNRGLNEEDFVETLYLTFFDRASEPAGKKFWVDGLKSGKLTKENVIMGFIDSTEWCNVCATYGVKSGAPNAKAEFASKNAIKFATRLYTCCLGREPEEGGLKYWSLALTNLEQTGCSAAKEFFTSPEFIGFKLKDDEYVRRLYTTFMGREPEASEIAYWIGEIAKGTQTKDSVMAFFGQSEEFTNICKQYGIDRGTI